MGAKIPVSADWDLDFGDEENNVVPIQRAAVRRGSDTQRGVPRVASVSEPHVIGAERPLRRVPPGTVTSVRSRRQVPSAGTVSSARSVGEPAWGTKEWAPSEARIGTQDWVVAMPRATVARVMSVDPQSETTLEFDSASLPRRAGRRVRASHADLDLMRARHDDPFRQSALIALADQNSERWQPWLAFAVSALGAGALLVWWLV